MHGGVMADRRQEVLVLAPHPYDETFGCGGTIRMLADRGVAVDVAYMTRGELGVEGYTHSASAANEMADRRTSEAHAACAVLGVREIIFFDGHDTRLNDEPQHVAAIESLFAQRAYQRVFCPWPQDSHGDHRATFRMLREAVQHSRLTTNFWLYEVWKPLPANTFVPIDITIDAKREAIDKYTSQLSQLNYRDGFLGLSAYRSLFCPPSKFAEAFWVCDAAEMIGLG
jgi:LmbE family N-acetylglucosaminyl deacetylase